MFQAREENSRLKRMKTYDRNMKKQFTKMSSDNLQARYKNTHKTTFSG